MKRIAIDARQLGSKQSSGIGVVVQELIDNIVRDGNYQYTVITSNQTNQLLPQNANNLKILTVDFPYYSVGEQTSYPKFLASQHFDLIHYTNFNAPIFLNKPKSIITVYDLIPWLYPNSPRQKNWFHQRLYRFVLWCSCVQADRIIVLSSGTKRDIVKYLKISPDKIDIVPAAIPKRFWDYNSQASAKNILEKYQITSPYFLYVGQWRKHKNLVNLLKAFAVVVSDNQDIKLVIAGKEDIYAPEVQATIKQLGLESRVIITGYIPDNEIVTIYKNAEAFVFPSLYEGFGIPPLEAMSVGVPVISSNLSVMPEVLGDAAMYFNPHSTTEMAKAMKDVIASEQLRQQLITRGYQQAQKYSFLKMADATLAIYRQVLGE